MNILRKTKIIATLGPETSSIEAITGLISSGANVFRLNFSHGTHEQKRELIGIIKTIEKNLNLNVSILADLQGPKIRIGDTPDNKEILVEQGKKIILTSKQVICSSNIIYVNYQRLTDDVKIGEKILINDGLIYLQVLQINKAKKEVECLVKNSGFYSSHKGVNFPDSNLKVQALTEKDKNDLEFILTQTIDYIALSFVRKAEDLINLKALIPESKNIKIIAKIEKPEAITNINDIMEFSDGIMVARGDLGVETSVAKVPLLQKDLIKQAMMKAKTVIVATQMLESMIHNYLPTRAESADVANAIIDGADALMLSGETAIGEYPYLAVKMMSDIILETETSPHCPRNILNIDFDSHSTSQAICDAAAYASKDLDNCPIIVFTLSGQTAWYLSNTRAQGSIFAFSHTSKVVSQLALCWNTMAFKVLIENDFLALIKYAEKLLIEKNFVKKGDHIVIISGTFSILGATNNLRVKTIGKDLN